MCPSMWGKRNCPGDNCQRIHLEWCARPPCFINEERDKDCLLWHGHRWVAAAKMKKSQKEARKKEAGVRHQAQGNSAKGKRGAPQRSQPQFRNQTQQQSQRVTGKPKPLHPTQTHTPALSVRDKPRIATSSAPVVSTLGSHLVPTSAPVVPMPGGTTSYGCKPHIAPSSAPVLSMLGPHTTPTSAPVVPMHQIQQLLQMALLQSMQSGVY